MFPPTTKTLIVDDMPTIRDLVKSQLKALGIKNVAEAVDGEAALKLVETAHTGGTPFDLIISDWNMPNLTGLDFLRKVRAAEHLKETPFVLLTSESERDQVTEAILAGVSQYVVKPFTAKSFEEKLTSVWNKIN